MGNYIGKSEKRVEDPRFIQGKGNYVANLSMPDMAHVAILRSPHAHANIKSIKTELWPGPGPAELMFYTFYNFPPVFIIFL